MLRLLWFLFLLPSLAICGNRENEKDEDKVLHSCARRAMEQSEDRQALLKKLVELEMAPEQTDIPFPIAMTDPEIAADWERLRRAGYRIKPVKGRILADYEGLMDSSTKTIRLEVRRLDWHPELTFVEEVKHAEFSLRLNRRRALAYIKKKMRGRLWIDSFSTEAMEGAFGFERDSARAILKLIDERQAKLEVLAFYRRNAEHHPSLLCSAIEPLTISKDLDSALREDLRASYLRDETRAGGEEYVEALLDLAFSMNLPNDILKPRSQD